ncbi:MAG: beta strand repeat-containing protein [Bacteroidota bacterium]
MKRFLLVALFIGLSFITRSQYLLVGAAYSQNFDNLGTGNSTVAGGDLNLVNATLNGWYFFESGASADNTITAGTGSLTTGDTYNFGTAAAADRTLGGLQSGALNPTIGFYFTNNTGSTITSLAVSFTGEQWRLGATGRTDRIDFEYSANATSLSTGIWVSFDGLDFTAPVTTGPTGALDGNLAANRTTINATIIGISIANGANFFIRWTDLNATGADDGLGVDDLSFTASFTPQSTDSYRTIASGDWTSLSTWESSPDNIVWSPATLIPTFEALDITIRNGHTVTFSAFLGVGQVNIENGGVLDFTNGILNVVDEIGGDIYISSGGIFILSFASNPPSYSGASPTIVVTTGGILRVSASGLTGAGTGVNSNNFVYQDQSILEYALNGGFSSDNVTYFPNADAVTIPIFKVTSNTSALLVGANNPTTFNGIFEANGTGGITWQNSGNKIFRNGIRGTDNITANVSAASAKFIINGATAEIGGTGSLTVPTTGGLEIGSVSGTTATLISDKTITGNISLIATNTFVELGTNDLTVTGTISGGGTNAYIRTNGVGVVTLNSVGAGGKTFPIGNTSYNPLVITNGNNENYSARVETGIVPAIAFPAAGINRTWNIFASAVTPGVTVTFQYAATDANPSVLPTNNMEILMYSGAAWSIIPGNNNIPAVGTDPYTITSTTALTINSGTIPYALGKAGGYALPLDYFITANAQKNGSSGIISWNVFSTDNVMNFEVQRSVNGMAFETIAVQDPVTGQMTYNFTDAVLEKGTILYRIRVNRGTSGTRYSNTVAIINDDKGLLITSISPNPVSDNAVITLSAAKTGVADLAVHDMTGRIVISRRVTVTEGSNQHIHLPAHALPAGIYHISAVQDGAKTVFRFIKQ